MALSKKIIFAVTNDLSYDQRMQKICRSLSFAGYDIELVGRERNSSIPLSNEAFKQTRLKCWFNKGKSFYVEFNLRLFFHLLSQEFEAVCSVDLDTIMAAYYCGKIKSAKLIYDAHEYFTEVPEVVRRKNVQRIWLWIEKMFVPKFDLAYTVSYSLAELFSKKYHKQFHVIQNVPLLQSGVKHQSPMPTVLYQGALNEGRGLEYLVEAMKEINAKLLLAGEGDLSQQLRQQVKRLNIESKIEFFGYVRPDDLKQITSHATIGVNLLENKGLSYYYSLSNKFFDYIHAGVPQICIDFPEYRKVNDEYNVGLLLKNCSSQEIKIAVERLISDQDLYTRLQKNCEVCAANLNWQKEEKKLLAHYDELLS